MIQKYLIKYEREIKYLFIGLGAILMRMALFVDFSWLKEVGDSFAGDNVCGPCEILDYSFFILIISGIMDFHLMVKK